MTPETLTKLAEDITKLRTESLFGDDDGALPYESEQHYLLCLAALDAAIRHATLAKICRMQDR
jgi:hypothetical protein